SGRSVCRSGCQGTQGDPERGGLRKILQRSHDRRMRIRHLEGGAMPGTIESPVSLSPLAGQPAPKELLVDVARLEREYYERRPDLDDPNQIVSFGTSGHRGSALRG